MSGLVVSWWVIVFGVFSVFLSINDDIDFFIFYKYVLYLECFIYYDYVGLGVGFKVFVVG